jgi:hypothetical protein
LIDLKSTIDIRTGALTSAQYLNGSTNQSLAGFGIQSFAKNRSVRLRIAVFGHKQCTNKKKQMGYQTHIKYFKYQVFALLKHKWSRFFL